MLNQTAADVQKILLVDDDRSLNYLNRIMLKDSDINCPVDECRNGEEALKYIEHTDTQPDVILLDINMPLMDGLEFLQHYNALKNRPANTRVFMLSSSDMSADRNASMQYPFVKGYFEKPLTEEHIEQILTCF